MNRSEFHRDLELLGPERVREKLAQGDYGKKARKRVEAWLEEQDRLREEARHRSAARLKWAAVLIPVLMGAKSCSALVGG